LLVPHGQREEECEVPGTWGDFRNPQASYPATRTTCISHLCRCLLVGRTRTLLAPPLSVCRFLAVGLTLRVRGSTSSAWEYVGTTPGQSSCSWKDAARGEQPSAVWAGSRRQEATVQTGRVCHSVARAAFLLCAHFTRSQPDCTHTCCCFCSATGSVSSATPSTPWTPLMAAGAAAGQDSKRTGPGAARGHAQPNTPHLTMIVLRRPHHQQQQHQQQSPQQQLPAMTATTVQRGCQRPTQHSTSTSRLSSRSTSRLSSSTSQQAAAWAPSPALPLNCCCRWVFRCWICWTCLYAHQQQQLQPSTAQCRAASLILCWLQWLLTCRQGSRTRAAVQQSGQTQGSWGRPLCKHRQRPLGLPPPRCLALQLLRQACSTSSRRVAGLLRLLWQGEC
jgi:hypothetical protein